MDLTEPYSLEKGNEYGYTVFESLPGVNIGSNGSTSLFVAPITSVDAKIHNSALVDHSEGNKIHLLLNSEQLIKQQREDTFCTTILK